MRPLAFWAGAGFVLAAAGIGLLVAACGQDESPDRAAPPGGSGPLAPPPAPVPEISPAEKARYALDRILKGPVAPYPLEIPQLGSVTLEQATRDLLALPGETLALLADPALQQRIARVHRATFNAWHGILGVLAAIEAPPEEVVRAWVEPVLGSGEPLLWRGAVRCLSGTSSELGELSVALYDHVLSDAESSLILLRHLCSLGGGARRRALSLAVSRGRPHVWGSAVESLRATVRPEQRDPAVLDSLAWWALLVEGGGPAMSFSLPRVKRFAWAPLALLLGESGASPVAPRSAALVPPPRDGWLAAEPSSVRPVFQLLLTGQFSAADARCALAQAAYAPHLASVRADRSSPEGLGLRRHAVHCMLPGEQEASREGFLRELESALDALKAGRLSVQPESDLARLIGGIPDPSLSERSQGLLWRVLEELPDDATTADVVRDAFGRLSADVPTATWERMRSWLEGADEDRRRRALTLVLRRGDAAAAPLLLEVLEGAPPDQRGSWIRRMAHFFATIDVEPQHQRTFLAHFLEHLKRAPESEVRGLAAGLLDLRPDGAEHFAEGLRGPQRLRYLEAWPQDLRLVPLVVAEAAVAGLGPASPREELDQVLVVAWKNFPAAAAPALAALERRLSEAQRARLRPVLQHVRFRALRS